VRKIKLKNPLKRPKPKYINMSELIERERELRAWLKNVLVF
jgi:hypothetical protein